MTTNPDSTHRPGNTPKPTDPADAEPTEVTSPGGQVEELIQQAERSGASTDPADSDIGEAQLHHQ